MQAEKQVKGHTGGQHTEAEVRKYLPGRKTDKQDTQATRRQTSENTCQAGKQVNRTHGGQHTEAEVRKYMQAEKQVKGHTGGQHTEAVVRKYMPGRKTGKQDILRPRRGGKGQKIHSRQKNR
jgi:hypothetical protein